MHFINKKQMKGEYGQNMEEKEINKILKSGKGLFIFTIIFVCITFLSILISVGINYEAVANPKNLTTLIKNSKDNEGAYAKVDTTYLPYRFAEEKYQDYTNYYYFVVDNDKYLYIVRLTDKTYKNIEDEYLKDEDNFKYEIKGYTFEIKEELKQMAIESANKLFEQNVITEDNFENYIGKIYIDETEIPEGSDLSYLYILPITMTIVSIALCISYIIQRKRTDSVLKNSELVEDVRIELRKLKNNPFIRLKIYLTRKYIVSRIGGLKVIDYKDIIWAYSDIIYVNGIPSSKTLTVCTKDKKKIAIVTSQYNNKEIDEVLTAIKDKNNQIRIGYTEENRKFFKEYQKEEI